MPMRNGLICLCLAVLTLLVYWKVRGCGFVNFDDEKYVYENGHVAKGLTAENIRWAFSSFELANYHPLTWISLEVDATFFGLRPADFHLENVGMHALNVVLLFLFLARATDDWKPSAFCAALFAVHPLHVESVAWVAERKDVLSGAFFMLTLRAYQSYGRATNRLQRYGLYAATLLILSLGLLAKQMLVTFPFVLLLLDYWPLRRASFMSPAQWPSRWKLLAIEKIPMLIICLAASVTTYLAQQAGGAMTDSHSLPLFDRICNAALSYCRYLAKFFWPTQLAVFYPQIKVMPMHRVAMSIAVLVAITAIAFFGAKRRPFVLVGWLLFAGMLVPVIGLVQVGGQSMADRYLYLPMIGLTLIAAWGAKDVMSALANPRWLLPLFTTAAAGVLLAASALTVRQLDYWRNTRTLFEHALAVTQNNAFANLQLAYLDDRDGNLSAARRRYEEAVRIQPDYFTAQFNLANLLLNLHQPALAIENFAQASQDIPQATDAGNTGSWLAKNQNNWGIALLQRDQLHDAFEHFRAAEQLDPNLADAHYNLGKLFLNAGRLKAAETEFRQTVRVAPNDTAALTRLHAIVAARASAPKPACARSAQQLVKD